MFNNPQNQSQMKKTFALQSIGSVTKLETIGQTPTVNEINNLLNIGRDPLRSCYDFSANLFPKQRILTFN